MRAVDYVTNGFGGWYEDIMRLTSPTGPLAYQLYSPSGGAAGPVYLDLQDRFGRSLAAEGVPLGLNPRFIDIARGPGGRTYLTQAIRFLEAYKQAVSANPNITMGAAYNTAAMRVGTSSPLTPSRTLIQNVISMVGPNAINGLMQFYGKVLSAL